MDLFVFYGELAVTAAIVVISTIVVVKLSLQPEGGLAQKRFAGLLIGFTSLYLLLASGCSATRYYGWREGLKPPSDWLYLSLDDLYLPGVVILVVTLVWTFLPRLRRLKSVLANTSLALAILITFVSAPLLLLQGCIQGETTRLPIHWSPDHSMFVQVEEFDAGAVDTFHSRVVVRSWNRIHSWTVFTTEQPPENLKVTWKDSTHLLIQDSLWEQERVHPPSQDSDCKNATYVNVICEAR